MKIELTHERQPLYLDQKSVKPDKSRQIFLKFPQKAKIRYLRNFSNLSNPKKDIFEIVTICPCDRVPEHEKLPIFMNSFFTSIH